MPANVETAAYANKPAWHREGNVLDTDGDKGMTIEVALPASGLDWEVVKLPGLSLPPSAYKLKDGEPVAPKAGHTPDVVPDRFNVVRVTDGKCFGTVGRTWEPVQNLDGFQLIDDLIREASNEVGQTWIEAAGALDGGKKVWVLAHLEAGLQIAGEAYNEYILFTNGHDGRSSVTAATTNVRVVCENTLALALGTERIVRVRHTKNAGDRIKEARNILQLRNAYTEELAKQGEWLVEQEMSDGDFDKFLDSLMPLPDADEEKDTPAKTMVANRRDQVTSLYNGAANLKPIRGTRWGALQAVIEYGDHKRSFRDSNTQLKSQFGLTGQSTAIKDKAFTVLSDPKLEAVPV